MAAWGVNAGRSLRQRGGGGGRGAVAWGRVKGRGGGTIGVGAEVGARGTGGAWDLCRGHDCAGGGAEARVLAVGWSGDVRCVERIWAGRRGSVDCGVRGAGGVGVDEGGHDAVDPCADLLIEVFYFHTQDVEGYDAGQYSREGSLFSYGSICILYNTNVPNILLK